MDLKPADIVCVMGTRLISKLISDLTGPISHVGLITSVEPVQVTQALTTVETLSLADTLAHVKYAYALQPLNMSDANRDTIVNYVLGCVGEAYDWADLGYQALDKIGGTTWYTDHWASSSRVICSELVAHGYALVGLNFNVATRTATPSEIYEFALANPSRYAISKLK